MRITKRQLKRIIREEYSKIKRQQRLSETMGRRSMNDVPYLAAQEVRGQNLMLQQAGPHAGDGLAFFMDGRMIIAMYELEDDMGVVSDAALDAIMDSARSVMISGDDYFEYLQGYKHPKLKMI